ncbi:MAG: SLC13 family permease [Thiolinea sp.]
MSSPEPHAIAVMALTVFALFLFTRDKVPLQTSALMVLCLLAIGFELVPFRVNDESEPTPIYFKTMDFFQGFGHEALVAVCALMVVGTGLVKTGALEPVGNLLAKSWQTRPKFSFLATLVLTALLSAFINNTPIVVLLIPILVSVALRTNVSPSGMLMPMGFASLLGGMATTIGTSTNLLVVSVATEMGLDKFGLFEFFLPAVLSGGLGILFLWLVAPKLLPCRTSLLENPAARRFTAHLVVQPNSNAIGKQLSELIAQTNGEMVVDKVRRPNKNAVITFSDVTVMEGDKLLVHDTPDKLKAYEAATGTALYAKNHIVDADHPLQDDEDHQVIEIIIDQRSPLLGQTLQSTHFIETYKMVALAVHRRGEQIKEMPRGLGNLRLELGDILLAQGKREHIDALKSRHEFLILDGVIDLPTSKKAPLALGIMAAVIIVAASGLMTIAVSAVVGVLAMLMLRCLSWSDVSRSLSVPVIMIVVSSLALGKALSVTGSSDYIATQFVSLTSGAPAMIVLSGLILLMAVFTNVVSNNAAAVIGTPIAISIAAQLGVRPEPFVLAVLFGANMSYATPMAYKTNLLIMSAGNYRFSDFLRVGIPLTVIMWLAYSLILPLFYDLSVIAG